MIASCNGTEFLKNAQLAASFFAKLRGLMGRELLCDGEGLFLRNCSQVHTHFMRFTIDVIYLKDAHGNGLSEAGKANDSASFEVVAVETLPPWKFGSKFAGARHVLEVSEGAASQLRAGDLITMEGWS